MSSHISSFDSKAVEFIKRAFPRVKTVGIVSDAYWLNGKNMSADFFADCASLGLEAVLYKAETIDELGRLLSSPAAAKVDAWYVPYSTLAFAEGVAIVARLRETQKPTMYARAKFVAMGGMISVQSVDPVAMSTWADTLIDILDGVPVGDIPIMRPKQVEVTVNRGALEILDRDSRRRILSVADRLVQP